MPQSSRARFHLLICCIGLAAAAGLLVALLPFESVRIPLDAVSGDGSADAYTPAIHTRFRAAAALLGILAVFTGAVLWRHQSRCESAIDRCQKRLAADARRFVRETITLVRDVWVWLVVAIFLATLVRVPYLDEPMRYDEAHTFVNYASLPAPLIVTRYDEPNNHILHTLCVRAATRVFGEDPWAIRLPALVCGILLAPMTLLWGTATGGRTAGITAGLMVAVLSSILEFSVNARGYTLASLLFAIACLCGGYAVRRSNTVAWSLSVAALVFSLWTVPTMLYGAVGLFVWLRIDSFCRRHQVGSRQRSLGLLAAFISTCVLTACCYLPVLLAVGPRQFLTTGGGATLATGRFLTEIPATFIRDARWMFRDVPLWVQAVLGISALLALVTSPPRRRLRLWQGIAAGASVLIVLSLQRVHPPERIWCFAVPPILILATTGLRSVARQALFRGQWQRLGGALGFVLVAATAGGLLRSDSIRTSSQTGAFREATDLVTVLKNHARAQEPIITVAPASAPLVYYANRQKLSEDHFRPLGERGTDNPTALVVTSRELLQTPQEVLQQLQLHSQFDPETAQMLLESTTAGIYRVRRRITTPSQ